MITRAWRTAAFASGACVALSACGQDGGARTTPPPASASLVLSDAVDHVDRLAREPMVVEHPNGTLFVTGYGGGNTPRLWRSPDAGATWTRVNVGDESDGAIGNSDVDLAVAPDGTLYFISMSYDPVKFEGTQIAVGASRDAGTTWTWTTLSKTRYDDRPWIEVTPDGAAHAIWNDGSGVSYAVSRDRGETWTERPRIHPQGHSSHLAAGPGGELAVRITPVSASMNVRHEGVELVAVSTDGGATWTKYPAPGTRQFTFPYSDAEDPMPRWVEPVAWDAAGSLFYLWTDPAGLWLARSADRGARWTTWRIAEGGDLRYFPYLVARGKGELAATWHTGRGANIQARVARIDVPDDDAQPRMVEAAPFAADAWQMGEKPGAPRNRDTAGEYIPLAFLRDGRLAIVTTIQDDQKKRSGFSWRTARER